MQTSKAGGGRAAGVVGGREWSVGSVECGGPVERTGGRSEVGHKATPPGPTLDEGNLMQHNNTTTTSMAEWKEGGIIPTGCLTYSLYCIRLQANRSFTQLDFILV